MRTEHQWLEETCRLLDAYVRAECPDDEGVVTLSVLAAAELLWRSLGEDAHFRALDARAVRDAALAEYADPIFAGAVVAHALRFRAWCIRRSELASGAGRTAA